MKPEYGPTLGRLLAPRWNALSRPVQALAAAAGVGLVVILVGAGLTLWNSSFSHGGRVPFSFSYRGLYRTAPEAGGYVRVDARWTDGALKYSFAVDPLVLAPYTGEPEGALPLYAAQRIGALRGRERDFVFRGEGKTRISNKLTGYQIAYTAAVEGREMYVRDVLLLPSGRGVREGADVVMMQSPQASTAVQSPLEVAESGVLLRPLKTFSFG